MRTVLRLLLALLLLAAACTGDGDTGDGDTGDSSTTTTTARSSTTTTTTSPSDVPGLPEPIPESAVPATVAPIIATAEQSIRILGGRSLLGPLDEGTGLAGYGLAIDDGAGGLIISIFANLAGEVRWQPIGSTSLETVATGPDLVVHDLVPGGRTEPAVIVTRSDGSTTDDRLHTVEVLDLTGGSSEEIASVGEPGTIAVSASAGGDLVAVVAVDEACARLSIVDRQTGEPATGVVAPEAECTMPFEVPFAAASLDDTGDRIAYITQEFRSDPESEFPALTRSDLVVADVATGEEQMRLQVGGPDMEYLDVDLRGEWVLATGLQLNDGIIAGALPLLLVDTTTGEVLRVDTPDVAIARFLNAPLAIEITE